MPCKCMSTVRNIIVMHAGVEYYYDVYIYTVCEHIITYSTLSLYIYVHATYAHACALNLYYIYISTNNYNL